MTEITATKITQEELESFRQKCKQHDWYYYFSDDSRVFNAGESAAASLRAAAGQSLEYKRIYNEAHAEKFNRPCFGTETGRPYKYPFPEAAGADSEEAE